MTVAAVILATTPASALADANGMPSARRIADLAWSGGAMPIVIVSADPDGAVAAALAGAPVTLAEPAPEAGGPVAQIRRGIEVAMTTVRETDGAVIWPARFAWVGAETVTSLIEAHGVAPDVMLTPRYEGRRGWPVLLPTASVGLLDDIAADRLPGEILDDLVDRGLQVGPLDLGDPGTAHDRDTPLADLPPYEGPQVPAAGHTHEWGAQAADTPEDAPLEGPAIAPFTPVGDDVEGG